MTQTTLRGSVADGVYGGAKVVDHTGPPGHPHRVTIMQLARARRRTSCAGGNWFAVTTGP
jgi:hypothetical protein